jgi:dynein heavy chain, axonemal
MINAVEDYPNQHRAKWAVSHCGQVILNGSQIVWTSDVEKAFKSGVQGIKDYW